MVVLVLWGMVGRKLSSKVFRDLLVTIGQGKERWWDKRSYAYLDAALYAAACFCFKLSHGPPPPSLLSSPASLAFSFPLPHSSDTDQELAGEQRGGRSPRELAAWRGRGLLRRRGLAVHALGRAVGPGGRQDGDVGS